MARVEYGSLREIQSLSVDAIVLPASFPTRNVTGIYFSSDGCDLDLSALKCFPEIERLSITIRDCPPPPLVSLDRLTHLTIVAYGDSDLELDFATSCRKINSLKVYSFSGSINLEAMAVMPTIERLVVVGRLSGSLQPLASLTQLKSLQLRGTSARDLTPLSQLGELERLDVGQTLVSSLEPISTLSTLKHLHFDGTKVHDLSPLLGLLRLEDVLLPDRTTDIATEANMKVLGMLPPSCRVIWASDIIEQ